jgi:hypothetical protein
LALGNELIDWQKEKDDEGKDKGNIFWEEFFVIERNFYPDLPGYLAHKFSSFSELIEREIYVVFQAIRKGNLRRLHH